MGQAHGLRPVPGPKLALGKNKKLVLFCLEDYLYKDNTIIFRSVLGRGFVGRINTRIL